MIIEPVRCQAELVEAGVKACETDFCKFPGFAGFSTAWHF